MEPNTNALMSTVIDHPQRLWGGHKERESSSGEDDDDHYSYR
jgi:hypothetical protein